jgi:hypothetical protein
VRRTAHSADKPCRHDVTHPRRSHRSEVRSADRTAGCRVCLITSAWPSGLTGRRENRRAHRCADRDSRDPVGETVVAGAPAPLIRASRAPGLVRSDHQSPSSRRCHLLPRRATSRRFVCLPPSLVVPRARRTPRRPVALRAAAGPARPAAPAEAVAPRRRWPPRCRPRCCGPFRKPECRPSPSSACPSPCSAHWPRVASPHPSPSRPRPCPRRSPGVTCSAAARPGRARPWPSASRCCPGSPVAGRRPADRAGSSSCRRASSPSRSSTPCSPTPRRWA